MKRIPRRQDHSNTGNRWFPALPRDWSLFRLKYTATINDDVLGESTDPDYEIEYVDIGGVIRGKGIIESETLTFVQAPSRARRLVRHGDVLVSTVRTYLKAITKVESPPNNLVASTGFAVIRPKKNMDYNYLGWALESEEFVSSVVANSEGVNYPAISSSRLATLSVPRPTLHEQRQIAAFLDYETTRIDQLITNLVGPERVRVSVSERKLERSDTLVGLLRERREAIITAAVTGKIDVRDWQPPQSTNEAEERDHALLEAAEERASYKA